MKLDEVKYFSAKKKEQPKVYDLALKAVEESNKTETDATEIDRRIELLTRSDGTEHLRQCSNFLAEAIVYVELVDKKLNPRWVPETNYPTPDISYNDEKLEVPVEVKHLNTPRDEHEALANGKTYGGSVNMNYETGLQKKIQDFIASAKTKFTKFNEVSNSLDSESGTLYLFFSKSIDAGLTDGIKWEKTMKEKILDIAVPLYGDFIKLLVKDINEQFQS